MLVPLLLAACAPSATTPSTSSGTRTGLKGPLPTGETWTISGLDQNNNKISGKVKLSGGPTYRDGDRRWDYDGDNGYILYYEKDGGSSTFRVWDVSDPKRLVACYIFRPFDAAQKTYTGAGLAGTQEEISAVFAKLSGTGTVLTGGNCTVTRE
ncbi:hypothetical protein GCM10017781_29130 [Deinococcus metalli]|nr:hypothetical protein GCM10017781_29130 [Deinococcus metalli]